MLGSALTDLLNTLADVPADERTPQQTALLDELTALQAALHEREAGRHAPHVALQSRLELPGGSISITSITRPKPPRGQGNCQCCGQLLPSKQ
jgi:hypothetical protein